MKTTYTKDELQQIQLDLEAEMFNGGLARFEANNQRHLDAGSASDTAWFKKLTKAFIEPFAEAIQVYLDYYEGRAGKPSRSLAYLRMLPTKTSAYVAIKVIFDSLPKDGLSAQNVAEQIGRRIEDQIRFTKLEESAPKYLEAIKNGLKQSKSKSYDHGRKVLVSTEKRLAEGKNTAYVNDINRWTEWPKVDCLQLGSRLIDIFADNVQYLGSPVIQKDIRKQSGSSKKVMCYLVPTETTVEWVEQFKDVVGALAPCYAPCVTPPRDWTTPNRGGFHSIEVASKLQMVKVREKDHLKRLSRSQMPKVYQAINALQGKAWTVNNAVLDTLEAIIEGDLQVAVPQREPLFVRPAPVAAEISHLSGKELYEAMNPAEREKFQDWKREAAATYDAERNRRGKYLETIRVLGQAKKYKHFEDLHFVYTLDFRGRIYCQSSLVSPQGGDLQKSLLTFSEGVSLGVSGYKWLAVHGANNWGEDKCSFVDRVKFIESITPEIIAYAEDPIANKGWAAADKPWQFLAWCFEWADLQQHIAVMGSPYDFVSHTAVAMDGSCSGIQHYSAMLQDPIGGAAVNLLPSDKPQDIYGEVAKVVIGKLNDLIADQESDEDHVKLARYWIALGVNRSITKKAVMTLPYGSTQLTCRESVAEYLDSLTSKETALAKSEGRAVKSAHPFSNASDDPLNRFEAEKLLSSLIWGSIGQVVVAARAGMSYIKAVNKVVCKNEKPLEWVTPTGFIVEQAIYVTERNRIKTQLMGSTFFSLLEPTEDIDARRMSNSCAPNYIHSFDASHLTLAVCGMDDAGMKGIAVIHDSFGTHAAKVDEMREILVDTFVDMYKQANWLEELRLYSEKRTGAEIDIPPPEMLGLDLELVRQSEYCFA